MNGNLSNAVPAATLVIFRERTGSPPELLVVQRSTTMAFAGGAIVFPGGKVEEDDFSHPLSHEYPFDRDEVAHRIAAIRETLEESGIAMGFAKAPSHTWIAAARVALEAGTRFSTILKQSDHRLDLDRIIPFARWCPNHPETRVFDTRFYIALADDDAPNPRVDETENIQSYWASAQDILDADSAGEVRVIFPTRRNLERLALFESFAAAHAQALAIPVQLVVPFSEERDGERHLCIPEGLGYPITSEALSTAKTAFPRQR